MLRYPPCRRDDATEMEARVLLGGRRLTTVRRGCSVKSSAYGRPDGQRHEHGTDYRALWSNGCRSFDVLRVGCFVVLPRSLPEGTYVVHHLACTSFLRLPVALHRLDDLRRVAIQRLASFAVLRQLALPSPYELAVKTAEVFNRGVTPRGHVEYRNSLAVEITSRPDG
jgi:hypothetical protein